MNFRPEWGAQYPPAGSTALDAPPGYITLYVAFFREGSFRLPITKFTAAVLRGYGLHISQINAIGLPRITHFEYVCRAYRIEPTFEMFNVFYSVTYANGFYSFQARLGVAPVCSVPLKSLHDWKQKFFYIRRGVIPIDMPYRHVSQGIPKVEVMENYAAQDWYRRITYKATTISQLDEMALVGAGMSLLWVPKHPLGQPVYSHQGKFGYSLINVLDPKAAGAMVEAIQADGNPTWLDQIRGRFLHPTDESLGRCANEVLGEDVWDDSVDSGREEVIVLSSGSSDQILEGLTSRCARAGTARGEVAEPVLGVDDDDDDDEETAVDPSAQLEVRKRARTSKSGKKEGRTEGKAVGSSRKQPSTLPCLDYVVVSDTFSGLGVGERNRESDPDDGATLSEHMKKKALADHKRQLDEQAAALLAAKKAKLQKEAPPAPSESEVDLGVSQWESWKSFRGDICCICSSPWGLLRVWLKEVLMLEVVVEVMAEVMVGLIKVRVLKWRWSLVRLLHNKPFIPNVLLVEVGLLLAWCTSPHLEHDPADSWGNPACDDLPHASRWNLTQGSRMNDVSNCHEFFAMSLPSAERMFQKNRNRFALLDDHVRAGVNFFATSQEILREWRLMGEETLEFEESKKLFVEEKEKFNAEKKGLQWRVSDAEQKLEEQKQLNAQKQKDWEAACERTNAEMQSQRDAIVRLSGEKTKLAEEANQARLAAEKKEKEYVDRIDKLEVLAQQKATECETAQRLLAEKTAECQASEVLAKEASADSKWLLSRGVPLALADRILHSTELATYMFELGRAAYNSGRKFGYAEGKNAVINKEKDYHFDLYKEDCEGAFTAKRKEFSTLEFAVVRAAEKLARKADGVAF
ncbi:hypothetical protein HanRHA438_Chr09g0405791 [Helianthus annuus]|nr:hypothetical protein HanRHA438_Chr09g0405791 [Helianthus annuus]